MSEENKKFYIKKCENFMKMLKDVKSEGIQINYLKGIEKNVNLLNLSNEDVIKIFFENVLNKENNILKNKNLLFNIINFLEKKDEILFQNYFFELLYNFAQNYEKNIIFFNDYLINISLNLFFKSENNNNNNLIKSKEKFFIFIIETDLKTFETILNNFLYLNDNIINLLLKENNLFLLENLIEKNLISNQFFNVMNLLKLCLKNENKNNFSLFLLIINKLLENNFILFEKNNEINNNNKINEFLMFNLFILNNFQNFFNENIKNLDDYFVNILNLLVKNKIFNLEILIKIYDLFKTKKYQNLNKIFQISFYFLSNFIYSKEQIDFIINKIFKENFLDLIYVFIIYSNLLINNLLEENEFKLNFIEIEINNKNSKNFNENLPKIIFNLNSLNHLSLFDFIIKDSINFINNNNNEKKFIFNINKLNQILELIISIKLKKINKKLLELLSLFLIDFFSTLFKLIINSNIFINKNELFQNLFYILSLNDENYQIEIIYPKIIFIMRFILILNFDKFNNNNNEIISFFFDYLLKFCVIDEYGIHIFKLLNILYNEKKIKNQKKFVTDKLLKLCVLSNVFKHFEGYFKFYLDLYEKSENEFDKKISFYALFSYSKKYEGSLPNNLLNFLMEKFKKNFCEKLEINLNEETFFTIASISEIYKKDKTFELQNLIDDYSNNFLNVVKFLFEKIDNNNNFFNDLNDNNNIENYEKIKNLRNEIFFDYFILNNNEKKEEFFVYGILNYFSSLISEFNKNFIIIKTNPENYENYNEENLKEIENKIFLFYNFIYDLIKNETKNNFHCILLNQIFNNFNNIHFFINNHTNEIINNLINEKKINASQINEFYIKINSNKTENFFDYIKKNKLNSIFLNEFINTFFDYEIKELNKENVYKIINKKKIINTIWCSNLLIKKKDEEIENLNEIEKEKILNKNSFFIIKFFNNIFNLKEFEENQNLFIYLLDNNIFIKHDKNVLNHFINFEYSIIEFYSIIREKNGQKFKINFLEFLNEYKKNLNVHLYLLRILSNKITFDVFFLNNNINENDLMINLIMELIYNLITYNSYQNETFEILINIFNNIETLLINLTKENKFLVNNLIHYYAKLLNTIFNAMFVKKNNSKLKIEINQKLKTKLTEKLKNKFFPNLIKIFYDLTTLIFEDKENNNETNLNYLFKTFDIILYFKNYNENTSDITKFINNNNNEIKKFFKEFINIKSNDISNKSFNDIINNYIKYFDNNEKFKNFYENLFIFILFSNILNINNVNDLISLLIDKNFNNKKFAFCAICSFFIQNKNSKEKNIVKEQIKINNFSILAQIGEKLVSDFQNQKNSNNNK